MGRVSFEPTRYFRVVSYWYLKSILMWVRSFYFWTFPISTYNVIITNLIQIRNPIYKYQTSILNYFFLLIIGILFDHYLLKLTISLQLLYLLLAHLFTQLFQLIYDLRVLGLQLQGLLKCSICFHSILYIQKTVTYANQPLCFSMIGFNILRVYG